eukprot:TRINITY_DN1814_c0_g2_i3.p1 TRINITY_DN1814_c0_g2~~TRINITY_DN1814_c0_g2_i3.p1  ORF type:complete len:889 (+),score=258.41 TRINITY_DN1814_c0_g2_i3:254-2668(+)
MRRCDSCGIDCCCMVRESGDGKYPAVYTLFNYVFRITDRKVHGLPVWRADGGGMGVVCYSSSTKGKWILGPDAEDIVEKPRGFASTAAAHGGAPPHSVQDWVMFDGKQWLPAGRAPAGRIGVCPSEQPDTVHLDRAFRRVPDRIINGCTLWCSTGEGNPTWMYNGPYRGKWTITENEFAMHNFPARFGYGRVIGRLVSVQPHLGRAPLELEWLCHNDKSGAYEPLPILPPAERIPPPTVLVVEFAPPLRTLCGRYERLPDWKGCPSWKRQDNQYCIFSSNDGAWFISDKHDPCVGLVCSAAPHGGRMPNQVTAWAHSGGRKQEWACMKQAAEGWIAECQAHAKAAGHADPAQRAAPPVEAAAPASPTAIQNCAAGSPDRWEKLPSTPPAASGPPPGDPRPQPKSPPSAPPPGGPPGQPPDGLLPGVLVEAHGLQEEVLNGARGRVVEQTGDRVVVELVKLGQKALKPTNLRVVTESDAPAEPPLGSPAAARKLADFTLKTSLYKEIYKKTPKPEHLWQVDDAIANTFRILAKDADCGSEEDFGNMRSGLMEAITKRDIAEKAAQAVGGFVVVQDIFQVEVRAVVYWTAGELADAKGNSRNAKVNGRQMELCGIVNYCIRTDRRDLLEAIMPFIRALTAYCNSDRKGGIKPQEWGKIKDFTLYRGGSFKTEFRDWFKPGRHYRSTGFLATTPNRKVAKYFIKRTVDEETGRCPEGFEPVLWRFELDEEDLCEHVCYLDRSLVYDMLEGGAKPTEDEFLFVPFSSFRVKSVDWKDHNKYTDPSIITISVHPDNRLEPEDLPNAPWG